MSIFRVLLACIALALGACGGGSGGDTGSTVQLHKKKSAQADQPGPTREKQTAGMVSAASSARSAEIADLKFDIPSRPEPGKPVEVELALLPLTESPSATMEMSGSEGLTVAAGQSVVNFSDVGRSRVFRSSVAVTPAAEGVYFLNVLVSFKNLDFTDTRSFSVPLIVTAPGNAGEKAGGRTQTSARAQ